MSRNPCSPAPRPAALEGLLGRLGVDLYGYADVAGLFPPPWDGWPRAISLAMGFAEEDLAGVVAGRGPTAAYYGAYGRLNGALNSASAEIEGALRAWGYGARAYPATVSAGELARDLGIGLCAPVQHKTVATRAGLGWIGKSGVLVTPEYGPRIRLATVFTDLALPAGEPIDAGRCGACRRCVASCPAGAIRGAEWRAGANRGDLVDASACRAVAERLMRERVGAHDAVCGVCVAVCPLGRPARARP